jgi:hypothetical protein
MRESDPLGNQSRTQIANDSRRRAAPATLRGSERSAKSRWGGLLPTTPAAMATATDPQGMKAGVCVGKHRWVRGCQHTHRPPGRTGATRAPHPPQTSCSGPAGAASRQSAANRLKRARDVRCGWRLGGRAPASRLRADDRGRAGFVRPSKGGVGAPRKTAGRRRGAPGRGASRRVGQALQVPPQHLSHDLRGGGYARGSGAALTRAAGGGTRGRAAAKVWGPAGQGAAREGPAPRRGRGKGGGRPGPGRTMGLGV